MKIEDLENIAIHCATKEISDKVLRLFKQMGATFFYDSPCSKSSLDSWYMFKEKTCYTLVNKSVGYDQFSSYEHKNYTIRHASCFLDNFKIENKDMETKESKGTIAELYSCASAEIKKKLESKFSKEELGIKEELPNTWEEFCENNPIKDGEYYIDEYSSIIEMPVGRRISDQDDKNLLPSKESAEAFLALMQLEQLRDCYRQGWKPDWVHDSNKYTIYKELNSIQTNRSIHVNHFLAFQTEELCEKFYENFKELIEIAKDKI